MVLEVLYTEKEEQVNPHLLKYDLVNVDRTVDKVHVSDHFFEKAKRDQREK